MPHPYVVTALLFAALAVLAALDASLAALGLVPWFNGLRWLRVHLITLGVLAEVSFGLLPSLAAARAGRPRPGLRWDIWLGLNGGLIALIAGVPLANAVLIVAGGSLIFTAAGLLLAQLNGLRPARAAAAGRAGRPFYIAALSYLLWGIFLGTGMWLGWGQALGLPNTKEVHVHANLWGFTAMVFAGLLVDLYPGFARRALAWPRSVNAIFWLMTLGALGLVAGPWIRSDLVSTLGLVLHTAGTLGLLANVIKPIVGSRDRWSPGTWHLLSAYVWFLIPTVAAPLIVLDAPGFPVAEIESNGGPILIYGWALQFGYAVIPYLVSLAVLPDRPAALGGSWLSLSAVHAGGVFYWLGLFLGAYQSPFHGIAFALWALSTAPIVLHLWRIMRAGLEQLEPSTAPAIAADVAAGAQAGPARKC